MEHPSSVFQVHHPLRSLPEDSWENVLGNSRGAVTVLQSHVQNCCPEAAPGVETAGHTRRLGLKRSLHRLQAPALGAVG